MADIGRPTDYSAELAASICVRLGDGESLRSIGCDQAMPSQSTIYRWLSERKEFQEMYARAREVQADTIFDEMLDIADNAANDYMERSEERGGGYELNGEHVQRTRLRLDTRKWMAAKLQPRKYGDKQLIGSDPENPLPAGTTILATATPEEAADAYRKLITGQ